MRIAQYSVFLFLAMSAYAAPSTRVADYDAALTYAAANNTDIVVYQRGSDWNHLGEMLYHDVWQKPAFANALGDGFVLVAVDRQEALGSKPVAGHPPLDAAASYERTVPPQKYITQAVDMEKPLSACDIRSVTSEEQVEYTRQSDGSWLAGGKNPPNDTITLNLVPAVGGRVIRLDFLLDDSLPGKGPGRPSNGNFAISEVEVASPDNSVISSKAAWANAGPQKWVAALVIDGISGDKDNQWLADGHHHVPRTLFLVLNKPVEKSTPVTVKLICVSPWVQHIPGRIHASALDDQELESALSRYFAANQLRLRNAKFAWRGNDVPRVSLMDKDGRPVDNFDKPRDDLTPTSLAEKIKAMQYKRIERDTFWAESEKVEDDAKAENLLKGLQVMGDDIVFHPIYRPVHSEITKADPDDSSGCTRCLQFGPDPRGLPKLVNDALALRADKKYDEALAQLDKEIKDPKNKWLNPEKVQRIMMGKFNVYLRWPGNQEKRFDIQRQIRDYDPTTFWGLGAAGYLEMHGKTAEPHALCYGWRAAHVKPGSHIWTYSLGTKMYFDHKGKYIFRILHAGGKGSIRISKVVLYDKETIIDSAEPNEELGPAGKMEVSLQITKWDPATKLQIKIFYEAEEGKTEINGIFQVEPSL
jgi:hypothetical protein